MIALVASMMLLPIALPAVTWFFFVSRAIPSGNITLMILMAFAGLLSTLVAIFGITEFLDWRRSLK